MLVLKARLTQARAAVTTTEVAHVATMLDAETSTKVATVSWDSAEGRIRDAEDWAALAEREAWERVLRANVKNTTTLASTHEDALGLVCKVALLKGELAEARRAWEVAEEKSVDCPMRWMMVCSDWWCLRGSVRSSLRSSAFFKTGAMSCVSPLLAHHG
jgi:hypothetical protein